MEEFYFCLAQIGLTAQPLCWERKECVVYGTSLQGASETAEDSCRTFNITYDTLGRKAFPEHCLLHEHVTIAFIRA